MEGRLRHAACSFCVGTTGRPLGSRSREHSVDASARPSGDRRDRQGFPAAIPAYTPWAVHTLELDGATGLPAVCVWLESDREDADLHFERRRNLETAAAAGIESRDSNAGVRVRFHSGRRQENQETKATQD
jgi:hypothetical protein